MNTEQITQTTHTERIAELRDNAEEAQAARLEVVTEIARLTKALRQAEACWAGAKALHRTAATERNSLRTQLVQAHSERNAARADAERLESYDAAQDREMDNLRTALDQATEALRRAETERDTMLMKLAACKTLHGICITERDAARQDAERLADAIELLAQSNGYYLYPPTNYMDDHDWLTTAGVVRACSRALAAHAAAPWKAAHIRARGEMETTA